MSKSSPLLSLAGAIAASDWPDPTPARDALDAMLATPTESATPVVGVDRLAEAVESLDRARRRRQEKERFERQKREAVHRAARARNIPTPRVSSTNQPARNEPEMEF